MFGMRTFLILVLSLVCASAHAQGAMLLETIATWDKGLKVDTPSKTVLRNVLIPAALLALATLAGSGAASEAGALWMVALDICVIAAMQVGYIGGSALFVAVAD
jgi:hypothetical protein